MLEASPESICTLERDGEPSAPRVLGPPAPHFRRLWRDLASNYSALFRTFLGLNLWLDTFDQLMVLTPYVLVAPMLFASDPAHRVTLGTLVQTSNSFGKVFAALSIISENWGGINEWRSCLVRLREYEATMLARKRRGGDAELMRVHALADASGSGGKSDSDSDPLCGDRRAAL